jgi:two-component system copper resistance phosphate regulon response regulator CusR
VRVLIVEDNPELVEILSKGLEEEQIEVAVATTFQEGRMRAALGTYDVIVLDVLLPGGTGFDLCTHLRGSGVRTPILMLTARSDVDDRVHGLECGADDYLTKPFAFRELLARIRALGRRLPDLAADVVKLPNFEADLRTHEVSRGGRTIALTGKEWSLLEFFLRNEGQVVDRAAISAYVWDENHDPFTNVLEVLIRRLRSKIDDGFEPRLIHTLRGAGYRFGV